MRGRPLSAPGNNATIHGGAAVPWTTARGLSRLPVGVKERGRCCEGVKLPVVKADYETEAVRLRQYDSIRREPQFSSRVPQSSPQNLPVRRVVNSGRTAVAFGMMQVCVLPSLHPGWDSGSKPVSNVNICIGLTPPPPWYGRLYRHWELTGGGAGQRPSPAAWKRRGSLSARAGTSITAVTSGQKARGLNTEWQEEKKLTD